MMTINFKITFDFFKESVKRLIDFNKQTEVLGELLDADIYGGPAKSYGDELEMWSHILDNKEKLDIFIAFVGSIIDVNQTDEDSLIYYTAHKSQHIGELTKDFNYLSDGRECVPSIDKCIIYYPEGKNKYECIWEILCS